ncbi:MAG: FG-GAP repeat protein [Planctomycetota bacterium]|nr:FG-GAP repeat protein [Planctomycetota bacterium]
MCTMFKSSAMLVVGAALSLSSASAQILHLGSTIRPTGARVEAGFGHAVAFNGVLAAAGGVAEHRVLLAPRLRVGFGTPLELTDPFGRQKGLGHALAMDATTLVAGAPYRDGCGVVMSPLDSGTVLVFDVSARSPQFVQQLWHGGIDRLDQFGCSVDLSGDSIIVGAKYDISLGHSSGTAYVFRRGPGGWALESQLRADDGRMGDLAGWSVAISGDIAVVGAPFDSSSQMGAGGAQVFQRTGTQWRFVTTLEAPQPVANGAFGVFVTTDGTRIGVGETGRHRFYSFIRNASGEWSHEQTLSGAGQFGARAEFGSGGTLLVGSPLVNRVERFQRTVLGWSRAQVIEPQGLGASAQFGSWISMWNDEAIVGARFAPDGGMAMHLTPGPGSTSSTTLGAGATLGGSAVVRAK